MLYTCICLDGDVTPVAGIRRTRGVTGGLDPHPHWKNTKLYIPETSLHSAAPLRRLLPASLPPGLPMSPRPPRSLLGLARKKDYLHKALAMLVRIPWHLTKLQASI